MADDNFLDLHDYHIEAGDVTDDDEIDCIKGLSSEDDELENHPPFAQLDDGQDTQLDDGQDIFELENHPPFAQLDDGQDTQLDDGQDIFELADCMWLWDDEQLEVNSQDDFGLIHLFDENQQLFDHNDDNHVPYYEVAVPVFEVYADGPSFWFSEADDSFFGIEPIESEIQVWVDRARMYSTRGSRLMDRSAEMIIRAKSSSFQVIPDSELEEMVSLSDRIWSYTAWLDGYHSKCKAYLLEIVHVRRPVRQPLMLLTQMLNELVLSLIIRYGELDYQIDLERDHKAQYPIWQQQCQGFMHHLLHPEDAGQLDADAVDAVQLDAVDTVQLDAVDAGELVAVDAGGELDVVDAGELNAVQANADAPVDVGQ